MNLQRERQRRREKVCIEMEGGLEKKDKGLGLAWLLTLIICGQEPNFCRLSFYWQNGDNKKESYLTVFLER